MQCAIALLLVAFGGVASADVPSADELFAKLENAFKAMDSYEVEYEVTRSIRYEGNTPRTAHMLWRAAPGRYYFEPLSAPPHDSGCMPPSEFRTVKSVSATEERVLLLGEESSFARQGDHAYVGYSKAPDPRVKSLGDGLDDVFNPTTLMLPSIDILKSREHEAVLKDRLELANGLIGQRLSPYRIQSDGELVTRGNIPLLRVRVERGYWNVGFVSQALVMELWLDPDAGWMPRERVVYSRGRPLVNVKVTEFTCMDELWYPKTGTRTVYDPEQPELANGTSTYRIIRCEKKRLLPADLEVDLSHAAYLIGDGYAAPTSNPAYWDSRRQERSDEPKATGR